MKTKHITGLLITISFCVVVGCANTRQQQGQALETWVKRLTPAIVAVCVSDPGNHIPDDRLATEAMKDKPELRGAFHDYPIKVKREGTKVAVMVCTPDGKSALIEDDSRTPRFIDRKWY